MDSETSTAVEQQPAPAPHRVAGRIGFLLLALLAAASGAMGGLLLVYSTDLPQIGELESYRPSSITELYDDQGREIGSFALQRRVLVNYDDIPPLLREAVISVEDKDFERHWGVDVWRVLGAAYRDFRSGGRVQGASTLTMQLSRNLFLSADKNFGRKIQEIMLAMQIERRFTKQQIFTMYANQVFLGHGVYGFEAGAEFYFSKEMKDLNLEEAALLAGLPKGPSVYSPIRSAERAMHRRNTVINAMLEDGKITAEAAAHAKAAPLRLHLQTAPNSIAPYFVEEVRRYLESKYGAEQVHERGLRVYTSLDLDLQKVANRAVLDGLTAYEHRHGWKGNLPNVQSRGLTLATYADPDWDQPIAAGTYVHGVVSAVRPGAAIVRLGRFSGVITAADLAWTKVKDPAALVKAGDLVYVLLLEDPPRRPDSAGQLVHVALEQESGVQGALMAIDNSTGDVKALVGGRDFDETKFDRATQALRQVGSSFKPYVYTAAVDQGAKPDDTILDAPVSFPAPGGLWSPHNYDEKFEGEITLRHALAESRNIPAVKLAAKVGMQSVISYVRKFGITSRMEPYLPVALGAAEVTLQEQVSAYSTFPDDGVRVVPRLIRKVVDYEGHVLEEDYPEVKDVIGVDTARTMTQLLEGVVQHGTAAATGARLKHPLGGKTGTTNEFTDAWFVGFSPSITCGVWVGFDESKSLGTNEAGALAALPIWEDFMRAAIQQHPDEEFPGEHKTQKPVIKAQTQPPRGSAGSVPR
ncbi:MAG: PBP1A family penicillin-binding protein [Acidobacteria bacterium]|nr:PBP1A family penicillin-binding protein [Acidobacteriota bacterium]MBV9145466.1 PBP1A family penicillin-binding protein [Acidobacteriota bacterium]